jgi:prepilin-type processing-associated H-X9-DG protein
MLAGAPDVKTALTRHRHLFGFVPRHPEGGNWTWQDGHLRSSRFGDVNRPRQPAYDEGDRDFGLFREIADLSLSMQFEDEGLGTRFRWQLRR